MTDRWPPPPPDSGTPPTTRKGGARRITRVVAALAVVGLIAGVAGFAYLATKLGSIGRVSVSGLHPVGSGAAQTILLTGSDSRAGETAAQATQFGSAAQVAGQRSDVIVLIRLNPATGKAAMLSIPRDMFVPIAGTSSSNRINVAFNTSPSQLIATIQQAFGIVINHYAQEDFTGLQSLTGAVGGVCMNFPYPARDGAPTGNGNESGLNIPTAGHRVLDGAMGLALVRSRYYQYFANGSWQAEGNGDIGRIQRQHTFMRALASRAIHASLGNPLTANSVVGKAVKSVKIDSTYTTIGLVRLGLHLKSLKPSGMPSFTLPYRSVSNYRGYGDVLVPDPAQDAAVIAAWMQAGASSAPAPKTSAPTVAPSTITVRVLNGSGVAGQARTVADSLKADGFAIAGFTTAPASRTGASLVTYGPGGKPAAQTVAGRLGGPVDVQAGPQSGSTVTVTTGTGFRVLTPTSPPAVSPGPAAAATEATVPPWDPTPC